MNNKERKTRFWTSLTLIIGALGLVACNAQPTEAIVYPVQKTVGSAPLIVYLNDPEQTRIKSADNRILSWRRSPSCLLNPGSNYLVEGIFTLAHVEQVVLPEGVSWYEDFTFDIVKGPDYCSGWVETQRSDYLDFGTGSGPDITPTP